MLHTPVSSEPRAENLGQRLSLRRSPVRKSSCSDGVDAGSLASLGLDLVEPPGKVVARSRRGDLALLHQGDPGELAGGEGVDREPDDLLECRLQAVVRGEAASHRAKHLRDVHHLVGRTSHR